MRTTTIKADNKKSAEPCNNIGNETPSRKRGTPTPRSIRSAACDAVNSGTPSKRNRSAATTTSSHTVCRNHDGADCQCQQQCATPRGDSAASTNQAIPEKCFRCTTGICCSSEPAGRSYSSQRTPSTPNGRGGTNSAGNQIAVVPSSGGVQAAVETRMARPAGAVSLSPGVSSKREGHHILSTGVVLRLVVQDCAKALRCIHCRDSSGRLQGNLCNESTSEGSAVPCGRRDSAKRDKPTSGTGARACGDKASEADSMRVASGIPLGATDGGRPQFDVTLHEAHCGPDKRHDVCLDPIQTGQNDSGSTAVRVAPAGDDDGRPSAPRTRSDTEREAAIRRRRRRREAKNARHNKQMLTNNKPSPEVPVDSQGRPPGNGFGGHSNSCTAPSQQTCIDEKSRAIPGVGRTPLGPSARKMEHPENSGLHVPTQRCRGHHQGRRHLPGTGSWPRRVTVLVDATSEHADLPLHVKEVPPLSWAIADHLVSKHLGKTPWAQLWSKLVLPLRDAFTTAAMHGNNVEMVECRLAMQDIEVLVSKGYLVEIALDQVKSCCQSFTVLELAKGRRRWILHPAIFNYISEADPAICQEKAGLFPLPTKIIDRVRTHTVAACFDFAWFFGQFSMPTEVAQFFCLRKGRRAWAPTTVPTGARQPPLAAQILCKALVAEVRSRTSVLFDSDEFIDNIRFVANSLEDLDTVSKVFVEVCKESAITINHEVLRGQDYTFLGMKFNHSLHTVELGDKTRTKLQQLTTSWATMSWEACQSLFGVLVFASSVLGLHRARFYYIYKFMRKRSRWPHVEAHVWKSTWHR
jgi:hypothetical protein